MYESYYDDDCEDFNYEGDSFYYGGDNQLSQKSHPSGAGVHARDFTDAGS